MKLYDYIDKYIELEQYASKLYENIKTKSPDKIANIADNFAKEEIMHMEWLRKLKLEIPNRTIEGNDELYFLSDYNPDGFEAKDEEFRFDSEKDFFLFALQLEKNSILSYNEFKDNFQRDSKEYGFFEKMIHEERKHMVYILKVLQEI